MNQLLFAFLCSFFLTCISGTANSSNRLALVIGNSAYQNVAPLKNPKNDASAMSRKLKSLGFEVVEGIDLDLNGMRRTVRKFVEKLGGADLALFFYAGHGLQVNGQNYMAPVDATLRTYIDLDFETVPIQLVLSAMERSSKTNLIFLDACRDNPLAANLARSMGTRSTAVGRGLARIGSGVGTFVSFSTQPGNVAFDGNGVNSPFTTALIKHLGLPGEDLSHSMIKVRREVLEITKGKQVPWEHSSLTGDVVLKQKPNSVAEPVAKVGDVVKPTGASKTDNSVEIAYWNSIQNSNTKFYEIYLKRYPQGLFADIAQLKIAQASEPLAGKEKIIAVQESGVPGPKDPESKTIKVASLDPVPTKDMTRSVQRELNRLGCAAGNADGVWGKGSQKALRQYGRHNKNKLPAVWPALSLLDQLRAEPARVCPLICRSGFSIKGGKCIRIKREASVKPINKTKKIAISSQSKKTKSVQKRPITRKKTVFKSIDKFAPCRDAYDRTVAYWLEC